MTTETVEDNSDAGYENQLWWEWQDVIRLRAQIKRNAGSLNSRSEYMRFFNKPTYEQLKEQQYRINAMRTIFETK